jgi:hypothetical protein
VRVVGYLKINLLRCSSKVTWMLSCCEKVFKTIFHASTKKFRQYFSAIFEVYITVISLLLMAISRRRFVYLLVDEHPAVAFQIIRSCCYVLLRLSGHRHLTLSKCFPKFLIILIVLFIILFAFLCYFLITRLKFLILFVCLFYCLVCLFSILRIQFFVLFCVFFSFCI